MGLYKPRFRRNGKVYVSPNWSYAFKHPNGRRVKGSTGTADRRAAQTLYDNARRQAALERAGLVDPYEQQHERPLSEHLDDWRGGLKAKRDSPKHVEQSKNRAEMVFEGCGFGHWTDISASRIQVFVGQELRVKRGRQRCKPSARTRNSYLASAKQFCRWMVRNRRAAESPLAHLGRENVRTDRRLIRRALTIDEQRKLLAVTRGEPSRYGMLGQARALLYELALSTGLRAGEIKTLAWGKVDLDGEPPTVTVEAVYAKNRRTDVLPLTASLACRFPRWRDESGPLEPDSPVIPIASVYNLARMLRADLEAAGIPYRDDAGAVADFHALRHTFITNLARGGVHPKTAQDLARHSDINLTLSFYTHTLVSERAEALRALPDLDVDAARMAESQAG